MTYDDWGKSGIDRERVNEFLDRIEFEDPYHVVRAWVVTLAYLLTDYRYLYYQRCMMNRRGFLKRLLAAGVHSGFCVPIADAADYYGKLFVFVQADGGWDPTSLCDPKVSIPGEPAINHWAERGDVRRAGNIRYAPFGNNTAFFDKYCQRMLVVNGVDAQTNSHSVGIVHNWSGRIAEGYPTTTALLAAQNGAGLSMPYLSFGGFSNTLGVTVFTRLNNPEEIRNVARPEMNQGYGDRPQFLGQLDWESITNHRAETLERIASAPNLLPRAARNRELYAEALKPDAIEGL